VSGHPDGLGRTDVARCWAGFASLGAGLVHLAVVGVHLDEWLLAGVFFAVLGAAQLGWGLAALARDTAPFARTVITVNVGGLGLWAVSRTTGVPFGPEAGVAEAVGTADTLCMALQVLTVGALAVALRTSEQAASSAARDEARRLRTGRGLAALGVGALVMSALTTPALAATESGEHAHPHGSHGEPADHHEDDHRDG
jgi:hypothetical protein